MLSIFKTRTNAGQGSRFVSYEESTRLIPHIRALSLALTTAGDSELAEEAMQLRAAIQRGRSVTDPDLLTAGFAIVIESLRRARQVQLYDVQLAAGLALCHGCIAEMQTGEGKTYAAIAAAAVLALAGRGVHVVTPNLYLAARDEEVARSVVKTIGMTSALLPEHSSAPLPAHCSASLKRLAYDADVTYGTGHEFGFDYLRDQLTLRQLETVRSGAQLLDRLRQSSTPPRATMQRSLAVAIVDEADSVLIDDAGSPLILSSSGIREASDVPVHQLARQVAESLIAEQHFSIDTSIGMIELTEDGLLQIHRPEIPIPVALLLRPWADYVQQALRALLLFRKDVHYIVNQGEVRIVDESTGRIFEDRSWQDGLHQAIETREGVLVTAEREAVARMTRQRFYRLYSLLCGMTGTVSGCDRELKEVYGLPIVGIPLRRPCARIVFPTRFFVSGISRRQAMVSEILRHHQSGRPVLAGTQSIVESERLGDELRKQNVAFQILNGIQNATEAEIIERAGWPGMVTIATNLAGRGTDICLTNESLAAGGLHVIVGECQYSGRMDRQLIGRSARQGDPGSAQMFVAADDGLIRHYGPWLAAAIEREADEAGEAHVDFTAQLLRIQRTAEHRLSAARIQLLKRDTARDRVVLTSLGRQESSESVR
ncbi:MAG: hypothetical protein JNL58_05525 [Planctomyces sp.]|nr:hypothetical protein [Planctomyces sp.]